MDFNEAKKLVYAEKIMSDKLTTDNVKALMKELLFNPDSMKIIHISGTNGKGSTSAYLTQILIEAGCRVGRFSSPAVFDYLEIFTINNERMSEKDYADCVSKVMEKVDVLKNTYTFSAFELEVAIALTYFYDSECDFVIMETGMGGTLDATNFIENTLLSIITSVGMDHMQFLGSTLEKIAANKAGIIKRDSVVISALQEKTALEVIKNKARDMNAEFIPVNEVSGVKYSEEATFMKYITADGEMFEVSTKMPGCFQCLNIPNAIEAAGYLKKAGYNIRKENIVTGIMNTRWPGRFEKINSHPDFYIDGGHNRAAAENIRKTLEIYFTNKKIIYIIGVLADKDYEGVLEITADFAEKIFTVTPTEKKRALDGKILAECAAKFNNNVLFVPEIGEAVELALAEAGDDGIVLSFGSLSYLGKVKSMVNSIMEKRYGR